MNLDNICLNCLKEKPDAHAPCPHCGFDNADYVMRKNQLPPYTILNGKYVIGRTIGAGGFGIVYLAKDLFLDVVVAVKELFPSSMMMRNTETQSSEVSTSYLAEKENIDEIKEKFIREARILAKHRELEGIVQVTDLFEENGTAYIVMEYLDGIDLKKYIETNGTLTFQETITLLKPVLNALKVFHAEGIIHRDISPDNIMLLKNGQVKLLDFGGAKNTMNHSGKQSAMVMVKKGYTPIEQYSTDGNIGSWTDIYALCATIYKCITGETPPDSSEILKQGIVPPSQKGVDIPPAAEQALLKGLEVSYSGRIQNIQELIDVFYDSESNVNRNISTAEKNKKVTNNLNQKKSDQGKTDQIKTNPEKSGIQMIAIISLAVLVGILLTIIVAMLIIPRNKSEGMSESKIVKNTESDNMETTEVQTPEPTATPAPTATPEPTATPIPTATPTPSPTPVVDSAIEKMRNSKVGDYITYGAYEQDNNTANGKEKIEWKVLAKEDNRILVISKDALDRKRYNEKGESVTWETSSIREWLNNEFINAAFTESEKSRIPTVTVTADKNPNYDTNPGNDTQDKVFLLSINEVNTYFNSDEDMKCKPTEYVIAQRADVSSYYGTCWWWLRSPGDRGIYAAFVNAYGSVYGAGDRVDDGNDAVRPAMWIDLNS